MGSCWGKGEYSAVDEGEAEPAEGEDDVELALVDIHAGNDGEYSAGDEGDAEPAEGEDVWQLDIRAGNDGGTHLWAAAGCIVLRDEAGRFIVARWCGGGTAGVARCQRFLRRWQHRTPDY